MYKTKIDTHGNILTQYGSGEAEPTHNSTDENGFTWLESAGPLDIIMSYWNGSAWATKSTRPNVWSTWVSGAWVESADMKTNVKGVVMIRLKQHRESLLYGCDWTQIVDADLTDAKVAEWVTYRQALRDFPSNNANATDFDGLTWPTVPS